MEDISKVEIIWAFAQLRALELIEDKGDYIAITDKGMERALEIDKSNYNVQERVLLFLYHNEIGQTIMSKGGVKLE